MSSRISLFTVKDSILLSVILSINPGVAFSESNDPVDALVKTNVKTAVVKASPIFEGRGDGIKTCPVTGEPIQDRHYQIEFGGRTVYFCCKGCLQRAKQVPARYLKATQAEQEKSVKAYLAQVPVAPDGSEFCNE
jgi:YHS domain-containing protein